MFTGMMMFAPAIRYTIYALCLGKDALHRTYDPDLLFVRWFFATPDYRKFKGLLTACHQIRWEFKPLGDAAHAERVQAVNDWRADARGHPAYEYINVLLRRTSISSFNPMRCS